MDNQIGYKIKKRRKELGMTQKQLGDLCGVADSAIRKYESGKIEPKLQTIHKLEAALGLPDFYLVCDPPAVIAKQFVKDMKTGDVVFACRFKGMGGDWCFSQVIPKDIFERVFEVWRIKL